MTGGTTSSRRTLAIGALVGLGVGVVLPLALMLAGGFVGLTLRGTPGFWAVGKAINLTAPVLLAVLDLPHTLIAGALPGHSDSALLTLVAPPPAWILAGMASATLVRLVRKR